MGLAPTLILAFSSVMLLTFYCSAAIMLTTGKPVAVKVTIATAFIWLLVSYMYSVMMWYVRANEGHAGNMTIQSQIDRRMHAMETWVIFLSALLVVFGGYHVLHLQRRVG